jgi:hypothetical protein
LVASQFRRFWSLYTPVFRRILLIESGSRSITEKWLGWVRSEYPHASIDLFTCFDGKPESFKNNDGAIFMTQDYSTKDARRALAAEFQGNGYDLIAVLCSNEPVMTRWKWYIALSVPSKIMVVNENADWFWLDRGRLSTIRQFISARLGLSGAGAARLPMQLIALPFSLAYATAATLYFHLRRRLT